MGRSKIGRRNGDARAGGGGNAAACGGEGWEGGGMLASVVVIVKRGRGREPTRDCRLAAGNGRRLEDAREMLRRGAEVLWNVPNDALASLKGWPRAFPGTLGTEPRGSRGRSSRRSRWSPRARSRAARGVSVGGTGLASEPAERVRRISQGHPTGVDVSPTEGERAMSESCETPASAL